MTAQETILIVDDNKDNRDFIVDYVLEPNGFKHMQTSDGLEGLNLAIRHNPDLILLDLEMPRLRGNEVLEKMAEHHLDIPVILMTFHGSEDIAIEVYRLGVKDYIKKPYYPDEMLEAIERALTEKRLIREKEALTQRILYANRQLQQRVQELNILYDVGKNLAAFTSHDTLLPYIVDAATGITEAETGEIYLIEGNDVVCRAQKERGRTGAAPAAGKPKNPVAMHTLRHQKSIILSKAQLQKRPAPGNPVSAACVPLILRGNMVGALNVARYHQSSSDFTDNDGALLQALADFAVVALENAQNYARLTQSQEQMRDTFERFVPPTVVEQALTHPEGVQPGGVRQTISVLFADIRGYTAWSENTSPEQVIETLNHYLNLAGGVILGWEGTLDKFVGDGLMAVFNAPEPQENHVQRAADAALAIMRAAEEVQLQHGHKLTYSIGVHVGEAVVGYIGTNRAINYTAVGDTVNLAKRIQEAASPGQILVEESVVQALGGAVEAEFVGEIQVKNRQSSANVYELKDIKY